MLLLSHINKIIIPFPTMLQCLKDIFFNVEFVRKPLHNDFIPSTPIETLKSKLSDNKD